MFYWVCLPFRFVWLHLMFPVAFLFVLIPLPPLSLQIWLPVSPSDFQRLRSMKQRLWTWARFWFSDLPFSLPSISVSLSVFVSFCFPDSQSGRRACNRQLLNHGTSKNIKTSTRVFTAFILMIKYVGWKASFTISNPIWLGLRNHFIKLRGPLSSWLQ